MRGQGHTRPPTGEPCPLEGEAPWRRAGVRGSGAGVFQPFTVGSLRGGVVCPVNPVLRAASTYLPVKRTAKCNLLSQSHHFFKEMLSPLFVV